MVGHIYDHHPTAESLTAHLPKNGRYILLRESRILIPATWAVLFRAVRVESKAKNNS